MNSLRALEYDKEFSREKVKDAMKAVVPTYKDPKEVNKVEN